VTASYDTLGVGYAARRRADPRIEAQVWAALGDARSVLNVGAGAGSYEPADRTVDAPEPSLVQIAQRPSSAAPAVRGVAEALPFPAASFDAALAVLTLHHWSDWRRGIEEMRCVVRDRVVVLTFDARMTGEFWLVRDYFPRFVAIDEGQMPPLADLEAALGGSAEPVPIPADCVDGFLGASWRRPERYLDAGARAAISSFHRLEDDELRAGLAKLAHDLESGEWERRNGALLALDALDIGYRLVVAEV
jgi:SAM-dependent methyltransferase